MKLYYDTNDERIITKDELFDVFMHDITIGDVISHFDNPIKMLNEIFSTDTELFKEWAECVVDDWIDKAENMGYVYVILSDDARQAIKDDLDE